MEKRQVNPWTWQDKFGYSQAWRVDDAAAVIFVAGQGPLSADGELVGAGDFDAQVRQTHEAMLPSANEPLETLVDVPAHLEARLDARARLGVEIVGPPLAPSWAGWRSTSGTSRRGRSG